MNDRFPSTRGSVLLAVRSPDPELRRQAFAFDGGTNMDAARDTHIHGGRLRLVAADRLEEEWAMFQGGKEATRNKLFLSRKAPAE